MSEGPEVKQTVHKISEANLRKRIDNVIVKLVLMLNSVKDHRIRGKKH
jgi:hypothetical protein